MVKIVFYYRKCLKKIPLTNLLQREARMSLADAHDNVDDFSKGISFVVEVDSTVAAQRLLDAAKKLGATGRIEG